ncbi:MAG: MBL fold metallo-hydrolase [Jatrophihabitans sp.]
MSDPRLAGTRDSWVEPGPQDLGGGSYRIPLPLPNDSLRAVNVYALQVPDGLLLIDGGWALADSAEQLAASLAQVGFGIGDIRRFLVTHIHRDHFTQAVALRRQVGARISLGAGERPNLERVLDRIRTRERHDFEHLRRAGATELLKRLLAIGNGDETGVGDWELPDEWLADGTEVRAGERLLRVIATPGHTAGHVVYHDPADRLLFAGDHVLPHITPSIGLEPLRPAFPLRDYLDSLRLMLTMDDAMLLPAHGPVTASVHQRVEELLTHHAVRLDQSEAVARAGTTGLRAARALTWTRRQRSFDDLDVFNQMLAVAETAAHLDVLVLQGRLTSATDSDGVEIYQVR